MRSNEGTVSIKALPKKQISPCGYSDIRLCASLTLQMKDNTYNNLQSLKNNDEIWKNIEDRQNIAQGEVTNDSKAMDR